MIARKSNVELFHQFKKSLYQTLEKYFKNIEEKLFEPVAIIKEMDERFAKQRNSLAAFQKQLDGQSSEGLLSLVRYLRAELPSELSFNSKMLSSIY